MTGIYRTGAGERAVRMRYAELLARWPVESRHHRLATGQGATFVIESGPADAPAVLLLHGSAANAASWMADVPTLARHFRVLAVDVIGEPGLSAPSRPPLSSGAHAAWLDEVRAGLGVDRASLVGVSLGGWLALDYATRHPERVAALVLLCPGGVGRHRNVLPWALPLLLFGAWGRKKVMARLRGGAPEPEHVHPATAAFGEFMELVFAHVRPRTERLPEFSDAALQRLTMPVMAILGARDVMIDSSDVRRRLTRAVPHARIVWLPRAGHLLIGHGRDIEGFLREGSAAA